MSGVACKRMEDGARDAMTPGLRAGAGVGRIAEIFRNAGYRSGRIFAGRERVLPMPGNGVLRFEPSLRPSGGVACGEKSTPGFHRALEIGMVTAPLQTCLTAAQLGARRGASMLRNPVLASRMRWKDAQTDESARHRVMRHPRGEAEKQRYADL